MIKTHERGAAEELDASYASLFRELTSVFRSRGVGAEEARDLAQESLVRTFVHLKRHGKTRPDLRPLVHTIAKRLYVERGRRARPQLVELPEAEDVADPAPLPADEVVAMEDQATVHEAVRALAPRHRRVISLWMTGSRPAEIARELGIKRNAADALLHRARRQLAAKLDPSRATLGVIGLVALRIRAGLRRLADSVASLDPSGSAIQAGAGIAVAGVAAVLLAVTPADRSEIRSADLNAAVAIAAGKSTPSMTVRSAPEAIGPEVVGAPAETVYRRSVRRTFHNPYTGEEDELISLESDYYPDREGTGLLDPVVAPVMRVIDGQ